MKDLFLSSGETNRSPENFVLIKDVIFQLDLGKSILAVFNILSSGVKATGSYFQRGASSFRYSEYGCMLVLIKFPVLSCVVGIEWHLRDLFKDTNW